MKRIIITESQYNLINKEILDEGVKEWLLSGLLALASVSGIKSQTNTITNNDIKAAEAFQKKLDAGDKDVVKYFDLADIEWNRSNVSKLKNIGDDELEEFVTKSTSTAKSRLKQGYAIKSVEIKKDTVWKKVTPISVEVTDTLIYDYNSDQMFESGKFKLNSTTVDSLNQFIEFINNSGGKIKQVIIESSTDKEPIEMGNDVLSQKRADSVKDVLVNLGVNGGLINIETLPEQGPDIYSGNMSSEEREKAREITSEFRYVNVTFVVVMDMTFDVPPNTNVIQYVKETVNINMIKINKEYKFTGNYKVRGKTNKPKKVKCTKISVDGESFPCLFKN